MFAKNKHHNEKCTVYALGNVVQNLQSTLEEKTPPRGYNPSEWIFNMINNGHSLGQWIVTTAIEYLEDGMVDCRCDDGPVEEWHQYSRNTYAAGMVFYLTNHNPDTTNRI